MCPLVQYKPDKYGELGLCLDIIRTFHLDGGVPGSQESKKL